MQRRQNKRPNQAVLPCGCTMSIYVAYSRLYQKYVATVKLEHNHSIGAVEYATYATSRRPEGPLLQHAQLLVSHGANPMLVKQYLNNNGSQVSSQDVYNLRQKMSFKGLLTK